MPAPKNFHRLRRLLETMAGQNEFFLKQCSETKILAVSDYLSAVDRYRELAMEVLATSDSNSDAHWDNARSAVQSGELGADFIENLRHIRSSYYESVLKPKVKTFLANEEQSPADIGPFYERAVKIDSLLDLGEFIDRFSHE